jgi:hypothetical protein
MVPQIPVLAAENKVIQVPLSEAVIAAAVGLAHAPDRYFEIPPAAVFIPVASLVLSHVREPGIVSALRKMAAAYAGDHPHRSPITVRALRNEKFLVLDGNSTSAVAIAAGWPTLPCVVQT